MIIKMVEVKINAGICGFITTIYAESEDLQMATLSIKTDCPNYKVLEDNPIEVDGFVECFSKLGEGGLYSLCKTYCPHAACPVAAGMIKAVEVACGLALPKTASIEVSRK